jgi:hypothetical protein
MNVAAVYPDAPVTDWSTVIEELDQEGYAVLRGLIPKVDAQVLSAAIHSDSALPARSLFGPSASVIDASADGYPCSLPTTLTERVLSLYPRLAAIADRWAALTGGEVGHARRATPESEPVTVRTMVSSHGAGEHQPLHQFVGEGVFPLQLVVLLSEPGRNFTGGELVMTEQRPRMQTRPIVVPLRQGDAAIIATSRRPHKGSSGYYQVNLKHAISGVRTGRRVGMEILYERPGGNGDG